MSAPPPTEEHRPVVSGTASVSAVAASIEGNRLCSDCGRERVQVGRNFYCASCLRAFCDALDRRRAAELRLPPLPAVATSV